MPEGSEQQNFMGGPPDEGGDILVNKETGTDDTYKPYTENPEGDTAAPEETSPNFAEGSGGTQNYEAEQQAQLSAQQQAEAEIFLADSRQRRLLQIQKERQAVEERLRDLEKDLTAFKDSKFNGFLKIFQPRINLLVDTLIEQLKNQGSNLPDEAKVGFYQGLITTASSLIAVLTAIKFFAAFLDALVVDGFSTIRLIIASFATCIIPIILIIIAPIYIPFLALIFIIGKIPLLKGVLTQNIIELIEKLKKQRTAWQADLDKAKIKVILKKQSEALKKAEKQVAQGR